MGGGDYTSCPSGNTQADFFPLGPSGRGVIFIWGSDKGGISPKIGGYNGGVRKVVEVLSQIVFFWCQQWNLIDTLTVSYFSNPKKKKHSDHFGAQGRLYWHNRGVSPVNSLSLLKELWNGWICCHSPKVIKKTHFDWKFQKQILKFCWRSGGVWQDPSPARQWLWFFYF